MFYFAVCIDFVQVKQAKFVVEHYINEGMNTQFDQKPSEKPAMKNGAEKSQKQTNKKLKYLLLRNNKTNKQSNFWNWVFILLTIKICL